MYETIIVLKKINRKTDGRVGQCGTAKECVSTDVVLDKSRTIYIVRTVVSTFSRQLWGKPDCFREWEERRKRETFRVHSVTDNTVIVAFPT